MEHKCNGCKHLGIDDNGGREAAGVYCCTIATKKYPDSITFPGLPVECDNKELDEIAKLEDALAVAAATAGLASCDGSKHHLRDGKKVQTAAIPKPTLGVEPAEFVHEPRARDLVEAILRKLDQDHNATSHDYKCMAWWAEELRDIFMLLKRVNDRRHEQ